MFIMDSSKEKQKKAELERKIRKRVATEEKAYRIVERFVDETVSDEFLMDAGQFITPSHYEDIVVERAIAKLCGYPICPNTLTNVSKQKYHISTRTNTVYDITERKNFCSSQCYKSSKFFEKQISNTPVWAREDEPRVNFELLPLDSKSGPSGLEVVGGKSEIKSELKHLQKLDSYQTKQKQNSIKNDQNQTQNSNELEKLENLHISDNEECKATNEQLSGHSDMINEKNDTDSKKVKITSDQADGEDISSPKHLTTSVSSSSDKSTCDDTNTCDSTTQIDSSNLSKSEEVYFESVDEAKTQVLHCTDINKDTVSKDETSEISKNSDSQSKVEYLMKLLDRKKHLLSKMAQIESVNVPVVDNKSVIRGGNDENSLKKFEQASNLQEEDISKSVVEPNDGPSTVRYTAPVEIVEVKQSSLVIEAFSVPGDRSKPEKNNEENFQIKEPSLTCSDIKIQKVGQTLPVKDLTEPGKVTSKRNKLNTVGMICMSMKSWITKDTLKFLKIDTDDEASQDFTTSSNLESKYAELEKQLGIDTLIGESTTTGVGDQPQNPVPHYAALEEESKDFTIKVREYYKGSFTYKPDDKKVKDDKGDIPVYLPTVDSHNQQLIRRKIVMERLDKSMPDLLPSMKLSVQDVFSELRQLVATFSLDNKNILFKPAEWTIVSLVILKMLSRRNQKIAAAFEHSSCKRCLSILFDGIGEKFDSFENQVFDILQ